MIWELVLWFVAAIAVEAITEIIVSSKIFTPVRAYLAQHFPFVGELVSCGYCFSVWVAAVVSLALPSSLFSCVVADWLIKTVVLHRIANLFHEGMVRWLKRLPLEFVILKQTQSDEILLEAQNDGPQGSNIPDAGSN